MLKVIFYAFFMWYPEGSKNNFWLQAAPSNGAGTVLAIEKSLIPRLKALIMSI